MNIPWNRPRREKSSSQSDCEGGQARRHFWIIQMMGYASLSVGNNLSESMLEVARRCHLSNSVTALLRASSTAEVPWRPPRNGDPVEGPTSTCIHKKNRIQKQPMRIQSACFEPNQCSCWMIVCVFKNNVFVFTYSDIIIYHDVHTPKQRSCSHQINETCLVLFDNHQTRFLAFILWHTRMRSRPERIHFPQLLVSGTQK